MKPNSSTWKLSYRPSPRKARTMPLPSDAKILADAVHFKEFYGPLKGMCGENALSVALICALRLGLSHDQAVQLMLDITKQMQSKGWAGASGVSYLSTLADEARLRGAHTLLEWDYAEPFPHDWHSVLLQNAAVKPIVLQVGKAYALQGQDGTGGDEAGVHYHFICVVGRCKDGYICMDGDNWKIEQEFSIYSFATLAAADICGLLMLDVVAPPPPPPTDDEAQEAKDLAALHAQVAAALAQVKTLQDEIAKLKASSASALTACAQLLAPFAAAYAEVEKAQQAA
jgi:hypothetical protein